MKKLLIALVALLILAVGGFFIYQNLPEKRFARHLVKARLFLKQSNYTAALKEYEQAHNAVGKFTPYVDMEVLRLTGQMNVAEKRHDQAIEDARNYLREHPRSQEGNLHLARLAFQLGKFETAFEALNDLLGTTPEHYRGRLLLAQVRERQGRADLVEEQYRILATAHPESTEVLLALARNLNLQRRFPEGRELLRSLLAKNPRDTTANLLVVDGWLKERQADSLAAALDRWQASDTTVTLPIAIQKARLASLLGNNAKAFAELQPHKQGMRPPVGVLSEMALIHAKNGSLDSAIKLYNTILDQNPPNRTTYLVLAHLLHLANKNAVRALEIIKTLEIGARERVFQRSLIALYMATEQTQKLDAMIAAEPDSLRPALEAFRQGMEPDPEFIGAWGLFNYFQLTDQPFRTLQVADSLHKRWPGNVLATRTYAAQLAAVGALPQAITVFSKLKQPSTEDLLRMLDIHRRMGKPAEALVAAHRIEKLSPSARGTNALLSDLYLAKGEHDKAVTYAERELTVDPENLACINNLAWIHGAVRGDYAKAEPYLKRLEAAKNSDPRILDTIGWILARSGKIGEAEPYFKLALNILPDNPSMLYHYGWLKMKQGDKVKAAEYLKKAVDSKAGFEERAAAQALLAELG
jgi:tetratricopeptide (TPR) repeat protein